MLLVLSAAPVLQARAAGTAVTLDPGWEYARFSKINSGSAVLYQAGSSRKNIVVAVNAGHGTQGGTRVKTPCHPDGSPKVTGGSTASGEVSAYAVSSGMAFPDGTAEAVVTLQMAQILRDDLLARGYDVLMLRDAEDVQLDNIARTVMANNRAQIHISLHWDSSTTDKGAFFISVPDVASYRNMEPVKSHYQEHIQLGSALIEGLKTRHVKIMGSGQMALDLTQTSYSTIPSVDMELGDKGSDYSTEALRNLSMGLCAGVDLFFGNPPELASPTAPTVAASSASAASLSSAEPSEPASSSEPVSSQAAGAPVLSGPDEADSSGREDSDMGSVAAGSVSSAGGAGGGAFPLKLAYNVVSAVLPLGLFCATMVRYGCRKRASGARPGKRLVIELAVELGLFLALWGVGLFLF